MRPFTRVLIVLMAPVLLLGAKALGQSNVSPFGTGPKAPEKSTVAAPAHRYKAPQVAEQAQGEPASVGAACRTVTTCFQHIAAGRPYQAVDDCFDAPGFAQRMLRDKYERLDSGQREYVVQLSSVMFKTLVSGAAFADSIKARQAPRLSAAEQDGEVRVSFVTQDLGSGVERTTMFVLHQTNFGWRIVDMSGLAERTAKGIASAARRGALVALGMEAVVGGIIDSKLRTNTPDPRNDSKLREAHETYLKAQLQDLTNQLELYRTRNGHYPDLIANGWKDLIDGGYIKKPPVNPLNKSWQVCPGLRGKPSFGWTWNPSTGELGACYFDEKRMALTPDAP
jgi:hypothetical protein